MAIQDTQCLLDAIKQKYISLENPDYSFVNEITALKPYNSLIQELENSFEIEEVTDLNDDVSFRYVICKAKRQWVIELSMLGRYATILRVSDLEPIKVVTSNTTDHEEQSIFSFLVQNQFEILDRQELEQPVPLKLSNTEPGNVSVYQALFTDTDVFPWKVGL